MVFMKAKVARFYGWTDKYISSMPFRIFLDYWKAITPLEAQETILNLSIGDFPHMSKNNRNDFYRNMLQKLKSMVKSSEKAKSTVEFAKILAEQFNGR